MTKLDEYKQLLRVRTHSLLPLLQKAVSILPTQTFLYRHRNPRSKVVHNIILGDQESCLDLTAQGLCLCSLFKDRLCARAVGPTSCPEIVISDSHQVVHVQFFEQWDRALCSGRAWCPWSHHI